jgi:hypothetical protein
MVIFLSGGGAFRTGVTPSSTPTSYTFHTIGG